MQPVVWLAQFAQSPSDTKRKNLRDNLIMMADKNKSHTGELINVFQLVLL